MTTVNLHELTDEQRSDHLVAWFKQTLPLEQHRRLFVPMLRELATGQPVEPSGWPPWPACPSARP